MRHPPERRRPPRIGRVLLRLIPRELRTLVGEDLDEEFALLVQRSGHRTAWWRYVQLAARSVVDVTWAALRRRAARDPRSFSRLDCRAGMGQAGLGGMEGLRHDVEEAFRVLRRSPGFTMAAALVLALGVGANTALFSVANGIVGLALPYPESDRLAVVSMSFPGNNRGGDMGSILDYRAVEEATTSLEGLALFRDEGLTLGEPAEPVQVIANLVAPEYFELIGGRAARGRLFGKAEATMDAPAPVAVLSHRLWRTAFGAAGDVVGRSVVLSGTSFRIVGVMDPDVHDLEVPNRPPVDVWLPLGFVPRLFGWGQPEDRGARIYRALARFRPDVGDEEARADLTRIAADLARAYPDSNEGYGFWVQSVRDHFFSPLYTPVSLLFVGAVLVLLLGCANVAHLLFARLGDREGELGVRAALGATRGRLARGVLIEALLLCGFGAAGGLALAWVGITALGRWDSLPLPPLMDVRLDRTVFLGVVLLTTLTAVLVGGLPALRGSRTATVVGGTRGVAGASRAGRRGLIAAEIAIAIVLAFGAGLAAASQRALASVPLGYDPTRLLTFRVDLPGHAYGDVSSRDAFATRLVERLGAEAGVEQAFILGQNELGRTGWVSFIHPDGPAVVPGDWVMAQKRAAGSHTFEGLGLPLVEGRPFDTLDTFESTPAVILSEDLARRLWPDGTAVGRTIHTSGGQELTVVGVTGAARLGERFDLRFGAFGLDPQYDLFQPSSQDLAHSLVFAVRTREDPEDLIPAARQALTEVDGTLALYRATSMERRLAEQDGPSLAMALLLSAYAAAALLLAAVGVYGVLAHQVSRTLPEAGVRIALGASPYAVMRSVIGDALIPATLGGVGGVGLALLGGHVLSGVLFGVSPRDPRLLAGAVALLLVTALLASIGPARRLVRLDPRTLLAPE